MRDACKHAPYMWAAGHGAGETTGSLRRRYLAQEELRRDGWQIGRF